MKIKNHNYFKLSYNIINYFDVFCVCEDLLTERISHKCKKKLKNIKRRPHSSRMMGYLFEQLNSKVNNDDEILNEKNNTNLVNIFVWKLNLKVKII